MSGKGQRFVDSGYTTLKPLIKVDGMPMIQHIVNLFPGENNHLFICNNEHLKTTDMRKVLNEICPGGQIEGIENGMHKGPVAAILQSNNIPDNEEVIVSYCDYGTWWKYPKFLREMRENNADGGIAAYIGFHPHMLGKDNYAFIREKNMWLEEIREKQPFTKNRMDEYASNGTYYFRTGKLLKKYCQMLIDRDIKVNGEFYVSSVYNLLTEEGLKTRIFEIENMLQWGTPFDLESYQMWSNYFREKSIQPKSYDTITILPMAGKGSRFSMKGYDTPKPLLEIDNLPMVVSAVKCLPISQKTLFIGLEEHFEKYPIQNQIERFIHNPSFYKINETTNGQATTCMLGIQHEHIDKNQSILISACDNGVWYDTKKYDNLINQEVDVIVWAFSNNPTGKLYPEMYSWLEVDNDMNLKKCSVKNKLPVENKYAIIGTMYFRKCEYFINGYQYIVKNQIQTNGEYYVDDLLNFLVDEGLNVKIFPVDYYLCWGTPADYETYKYWQNFFDKCTWHSYKKK